jgi:putative colanic acid biosynthesis glycosyltransferase WcaI
VKLVVVTPHFAPDVAPTGEVITKIVEQLAARGHHLEVITSLPWYEHHAVEPEFRGRSIRSEAMSWGKVTRVNPFPTDKRDIPRRALAFGGFSALVGGVGLVGGKVDGVLAVSPPLTLGLTGWGIAIARRAPLVFNIHDVFPDVAIELGVLKDERVIGAAKWLERVSYARADAVTVLAEDMRENVAAKLAPDQVSKVRVIPNFVDTAWITPQPRENSYRRELGLDGKTVVMYAGNIGMSQSLELVLDAATALAHDPEVAFVINGGGAARPGLEVAARGLPNVQFVDLQPRARLPEVLAAADIHVVPLKRGLGRSSVPSKTYSILAAGRPVLASVDRGTEVERIVEQSGAGVSVPPDDPEAFTKALTRLVAAPDELARMGAAGRRFVEGWASPGAVAEQYEQLFTELREHRR